MTPRKRMATFGERGNLVRFYEEERNGVRHYIVQYGPKDARRQESFPRTKGGKAEAEAFFAGFKQEREKGAERVPLTNRQLWQAYLTAEAEHLRAKSLRLYTDDWRTWEQFAGAHTIAQDTTVQQIGEFRRALDARGLATATVYNTIRNVRIVFNWGERMELLDRNRWHLFVYKVAKEKRTKPRAEYRSDEFLRIWSALDPSTRGQWRAWVAVGLLGIYGNRQNEILNFQWSWIVGDVVRIPAEYVKTGEEGTLTLFPQTRRILDIARDWAAREGYSGPYVLFPGQSVDQRGRRGSNPSKRLHYSIQSLTDAIHRAEGKAGVETIKWRAGHGFRRGLMGDLVDQTGDVTLALQAIGDRDLSMAQHYRVRRNDRVDEAIQERARRILPAEGEPEGATKVQPEPGNDEAASVAASVSHSRESV